MWGQVESAGSPDFGYLGVPVIRTPMRPMLTVFRPYGGPFGMVDPAIISAGITAATSVATTAITEGAAIERAKAAAKKKAKAKKKAPVAAVADYAPSPPPASGNTLLYVGGGVALLALIGGAVWYMRNKAAAGRRA